MLVQCLAELVNERKYFELLTEDGPLLLWTNREGPFNNQMSEFLLGLDVLSNATVLRTFFKLEIHHLFGLFLMMTGSWGYFLSLGFLSFGLLAAIPP